MARKAFLIGINTQGLQYCTNDVNLMTECLTLYEYEVCSFTDCQKQHELEKNLRDWTDGCSRTDTALFYFSGHGLIRTGALQLLLDEGDNKLPFHAVNEALTTCKAQNRLIVLDCCYAGAGHAEWTPNVDVPYRLLTASERVERTKEFDDLESSFLTYHICSLLKDPFSALLKDGSQTIYINNLYDHLIQAAKKHNGTPNSVEVPLPNLLGNARHNFNLGQVSTDSPPPPLLPKPFGACHFPAISTLLGAKNIYVV